MTEGPAAQTPGGEGTGNGRSLRELAKDRRLSGTALVAIAGLVALAVWLIVESTSDDDSGVGQTTVTETSGPVTLSANGLATLAAAGGSPIYWVGPRPGVWYELKQSNGQIYVRYLPKNVQAGDTRPFLTVATYPVDNAFAVTSAIESQGAEKLPVEGGGIAVLPSNRPNSAYVAYPDVDFQIEVYDPDPKVVRRLATSGAVEPVPLPAVAAQARGPEAVTEDELIALSQTLGHPIYWAGPREDTTYELTVNSEGSVYVRYLSEGAEVGSKPPALTVVTYKLADAYEATKNSASGDAVVIQVPNGGVALHPQGNAHNVHLAYPGEDVQAEVYSPLPREAPRLVRRGAIVPVG